ncbi:hypothetical protein GCM10022380_15860 [Amycolatopsis tucumanensis]|uniref:Uncharacterized protein n=1 Tax=Amycolatopsis tucumanensis TaxID=401106 RepID=A0ABP7HPN3_9PSEU
MRLCLPVGACWPGGESEARLARGAQAGAVLGVLGYGEVAPVRLPAGMVSRVPLGSALDPAAVLG